MHTTTEFKHHHLKHRRLKHHWLKHRHLKHSVEILGALRV